jgi:hypothetical protein
MPAARTVLCVITIDSTTAHAHAHAYAHAHALVKFIQISRKTPPVLTDAMKHPPTPPSLLLLVMIAMMTSCGKYPSVINCCDDYCPQFVHVMTSSVQLGTLVNETRKLVNGTHSFTNAAAF